MTAANSAQIAEIRARAEATLADPEAAWDVGVKSGAEMNDVALARDVLALAEVAEAALYSVTPCDGWKATDAQARLEQALSKLESLPLGER